MNSNYDTYKARYVNLMIQWAKDVRKWTNNGEGIFYMDGIFDPQKWFDETNKFRPLFILKEPNEQKLEEAKKEIGNHEVDIDNCIDFVATDKNGSDPWLGAGMWRRLGNLAAALFELCENGKEISDFGSVNNQIINHQEICRRIAIINLKKMAGGGTADSDKSKKSFCFECHAARFKNELKEQIRIIRPSIIICCGKDVVKKCLGIANENYLKIDEEHVPIINAYHPAMRGKIEEIEEKFYKQTLKAVKAAFVRD